MKQDSLAKRQAWETKVSLRNLFLLMVVLVMACAAPAQSPPTNNKQKFIEELLRFRLSMENVTKLVHAFQELEKLPEKDTLGDSSDDPSLDDLENRVASHPKVQSVLEKAGLTPREYAIGLACFVE